MASIYRLQYPKSAQNTRGTGYISPYNAAAAKNFELALAEAERRAGIEAANVEGRRAYIEATADALRKDISALKQTRLDLIEGDIDREQAANNLRFREARTDARTVYGAQMRGRPTVSSSTAVRGTGAGDAEPDAPDAPEVERAPKSREMSAVLGGADPNLMAQAIRGGQEIAAERGGYANSGAQTMNDVLADVKASNVRINNMTRGMPGINTDPVNTAAARVQATEIIIAQAATDSGLLADDIRTGILQGIETRPSYIADLMTLQAIGGDAEEDDDDGAAGRPTTTTTTRTSQQTGAEATLAGTAGLAVEDTAEMQAAIDAEIATLSDKLNSLELPEEVTTDLIESARQIYRQKFTPSFGKKRKRSRTASRLLNSSLTAADLDKMMQAATAPPEPVKQTNKQADEAVRMSLMQDALEGEPLDMDALPDDSPTWKVIELYNGRGEMSNDELTNTVLMDFPAKDRAAALTTLYQMINQDALAGNAAHAIPSPENDGAPARISTNANP